MVPSQSGLLRQVRSFQKTKVYLGEYATHIPGRKANMETALTEALYLTALERNGDVVHMTSYAPLLAKKKDVRSGIRT